LRGLAVAPDLPDITVGVLRRSSTAVGLEVSGESRKRARPTRGVQRRFHARLHRPSGSSCVPPRRRRRRDRDLRGVPDLPGTLNPDARVFSITVYLAEIHGFFSLIFFYFQIWTLRGRRVRPLQAPLTIDAFITTYNEDVDLLRQTVRAAIQMRHPHRTFVLDDGRRPEVRALCEELGCEYLTRPDNAHAKAGNWNHAFMQTNADLIATFDADHVPRADFLERTLGFFDDPKVALVQVPQRYHNLDSLQHRVSWRMRRLYGEQDVFFNLVMPGKDHWNASFFCGTGAVLRREALVPSKGLLTGTITEDMHTSLVLQTGGWKSVYLNELLVTGLAPMDFSSYSSQRLRWAEGNLKIILHVNPLTSKGLTFTQRICYFASMYHWTIGFPKIVFYLAPPLILFTGSTVRICSRSSSRTRC
jgi:cellulose synthase (UDP-forming)